MEDSKFSPAELDNAIKVLPDNMGIAVVENPENQEYVNSIYLHLKAEGIIYTHEAEGTGVICAGLTEEGLLLRDKGGFSSLYKKEQQKNRIQELELEALEYEQKIRQQNNIIRYWQLVSIGIAIIGFILGYFFKIKF